MKTLEQAFNANKTSLALVESEARNVLGDFCTRNNFLLVGRAKDIESLRDKMETGRYPDFKSIDDAIAFSIVIDTLDQEDEVRRFIRNAFTVSSMKSGNTIRDERTFDFDSTRMYCRLIDNLETGIGEIIFEVQIRTLLQHAWSKITHRHVYKAQVYDSRAGRLAAELMAQLEAADRTFSRFDAVSKTVKVVARQDVVLSNSLTAMIDELVKSGTIPSEMRPANGRRLGENMLSAIRKDFRRELNRPLEIIRNFLEGQKPSFPRSVSLFQLSIVALYQAGMLELGSRHKPRRYYITDELVSLFPIVETIAARVEVD